MSDGSPKIEERLSNYEPNWPIGGAIAINCAKLLITPKPYVVDSSVLYHWKGEFMTNKTYISDFICAMIDFPPF